MTQLSLFADGDVPQPLMLEELVARAQAYVRTTLARRVCVACCEDGRERRLVFRHRRRSARAVPVWQLVALGVSLARLQAEIAGCDVVCRRCLLQAPKPQMLRSGLPRFHANSGERSRRGRHAA